MKQKLNCTFITPYKDKEIFNQWKKKLEKSYDDIQIIGIQGGLVEFEKDGVKHTKPRTPFFEAWKQALPQITKKYVCLTHDDTEYIGIPDLDKYFNKPLLQKNKLYNNESVFGMDIGMIGIAGTTVLHKDQPWWFSTERLRGGLLSGQVFNTEEGGKVSRSDFGPFGEVVVLDGVCMITTKEILEDVGIPNVDYGPLGQVYTLDFYDHVLSLEYVKKGYKILTVPIVLVHGSKGGDKRQSFFDSLDKFKAEYLEDKTWRI